MGVLSNPRFAWRAWRYRLRHDPAEVALVRRVLRRGDTALDIGAHKGAYTYWMAKAVGRDGRVVSFEPQPALASRLTGAVRSQGWRHVTVENLALSREAGTMRLHVPAGGPSPGATLNGTAGEAGEAYDVRVDTVDGYAAAHGLARIRLIKCDVEGHELATFEGAQRVLREQRPTLLFECEQRHHRDDAVHDVFACLHSLGYRGRFFSGRELLPLERFDVAVHQSESAACYVNNFVFTHPEAAG